MLKKIILLLGSLSVCLILLACGGPATDTPTTTDPSDPDNPTATTTIPSATTTSPLPTATSALAGEGGPLHLNLDYLGIMYNHNTQLDDLSDIYFLVIITDGYTTAASRFLPDGSNSYPMGNYEILPIDQELFSTDKAGDSFKVVFMAFKQNDATWRNEILLPALESIKQGLDWNDYRNVDEINRTVATFTKNSGKQYAAGGDELIGYYENIWDSRMGLGSGTYSSVGKDELRLWFRIWSETPQNRVINPRLTPDVTISTVDMLSTVKTGQERRDIVSLVNNEPNPVRIKLVGNSTTEGEFYNQYVELTPATIIDEYKVRPTISYIETTATLRVPGQPRINYEIYLDEYKIDDWYKTIKVITSSDVSLVEWRNMDSQQMETETLEGAYVYVYVEASGYNGSSLMATIRQQEPDGTYSYVTNLSVPIGNGRGLVKWKTERPAGGTEDYHYVVQVKEVSSQVLTVHTRGEVNLKVELVNLTVNDYVSAGQTRTDTITITNNEDYIAVIRLIGNSSRDGEFYNAAISIPPEETASYPVSVTTSTPGVTNITYSLSYNGIEFDNASALLEVFE